MTEPSSLEVWPACRGSVYCSIEVDGRAGHAEQQHPHFSEGGAVNAIDKPRHLLAGVDVRTQLTELTFEIGLSWVAVGFAYLLFLTRMFRRAPPEMYSGDEEGDELVSAPARA